MGDSGFALNTASARWILFLLAVVDFFTKRWQSNDSISFLDISDLTQKWKMEAKNNNCFPFSDDGIIIITTIITIRSFKQYLEY